MLTGRVLRAGAISIGLTALVACGSGTADTTTVDASVITVPRISPPGGTDGTPGLGTNHITVTEDDFETIAAMAGSSATILVGEVTAVDSLGRPDLEEDPLADEYVAISVAATEILGGDPQTHVVIPWSAYQVNEENERVAEWIANGLPAPRLGDHLVLFVNPASDSVIDHLGEVVTHSIVALDGVAHLHDGRIGVVEQDSAVAASMIGLTVDQLRAELR